MTRNWRVGRKRFLQEENGQALILALIVVMIVAIAATSIAGIVTSTQNTSMRERQGVHAFTGSEAGLDLAANAVLQTFPSGATSLPPDPAVLSDTQTVDGGTVNWTATYVAGPPDSSGLDSPGSWNLEAKTVSPNGKVTRLLQGTMEPSSTTDVLPQSTIYGYGLVTGGAPCSTCTTADDICTNSTTQVWGGHEAVTVPIWIGGDLCLHPSNAGGAPIIGNPTTCSDSSCTIPVVVKGQLAVDGPDDAIGSNNDPTGYGNGSAIASAAVLGGCWSYNNATPCDYNSVAANHGGSGVYANDFAPALPSPQPTKPTVDAQTEYDVASPGPKHPCTTGDTGSSFYFDNDTTLSTSPAAQNLVTFLGPSAWDCRTGSGELQWTPNVPAGTDGTLYVSGKVFIDASLTMANNDFVLLDAPAGGASIYINGTLNMSTGSSLCALYNPAAANPCDFDNWTPSTDPTDPVVFFAALHYGSSTGNGWTMANDSYFEGLAFTNGGFDLDPHAEMGGSVFADWGTINGQAQFTLTDQVPQGAPGAASTVTTTTWSVASRTWRECPSVAGCS